MYMKMCLHQLFERGLLYHDLFFLLNVTVSTVLRHRFQYLDWRTACIAPIPANCCLYSCCVTNGGFVQCSYYNLSSFFSIIISVWS